MERFCTTPARTVLACSMYFFGVMFACALLFAGTGLSPQLGVICTAIMVLAGVGMLVAQILVAFEAPVPSRSSCEAGSATGPAA